MRLTMKLPPMRLFLFPAALALGIAGLTACAPKSAEPVASNYQMGERATVGPLVYTVLERKWLSQAGAGVDARVPLSRFFLVGISAVNNSNSQAIMPMAVLVDDAGATYNELEDGDGFPDFLGSLRMVAPGATSRGNLAFDVPPKHYKLKLTDEEGKQVALIDLPLTFESDVPELDTPLPTDQGAAPKKK